MTRDDIDKLLGGYAAGTLTPGERQALFEAALDDQQLFESLAAEEPLREVLQDPAARAQLLAALDERPAPWYRRWMRPALGVAAATAMVLLAVLGRHEPPKAEPVIVAETRREPVRSFQPPLPVEKSPLPTALQSRQAVLPPPPALPASTPAPTSLDAVVRAAPVAPPAPAAAISQTSGAPPAAVAESESAKVAAAPMPRLPAFRASNFAAARGDNSVAPYLGLRYTMYKKSPSGDLAAVDPQDELNRDDEIVIRFEANQPGLLTVSRLDPPNGPQLIASDRVLPSVPYTVPAVGSLRATGPGSNEYQVRFLPQPQNDQKREQLAGGQVAGGQAGAVSVLSKAGAQEGTFTITLKYK